MNTSCQYMHCGGGVGALPFTFEEIAVYFTQVPETRPEKLHSKCVVFTQSPRGILGGILDPTLLPPLD